MQEFDHCPECKKDLLLEHLGNKDNEISCLECGYSCQSTEHQDSNSNGALTITENEKIAYWQSRCKAAESVIESINTKNDAMYLVVQQAWLEIKENGEPA